MRTQVDQVRVAVGSGAVERATSCGMMPSDRREAGRQRTTERSSGAISAAVVTTNVEASPGQR